jgi:hypothetical protein
VDKSQVDDNIIVICTGLILLVAGLGFLFARADKSAKEKDEKRFGPLSPFNMGGWYLVMQNKSTKYIIVIYFISAGFFLIVYGLKSMF